MRLSFKTCLILGILVAGHFIMPSMTKASEPGMNKETLISKIKEDIQGLQVQLDHFDPTVKDYYSPEQHKASLRRNQESLQKLFGKEEKEMILKAIGADRAKEFVPHG